MALSGVQVTRLSLMGDSMGQYGSFAGKATQTGSGYATSMVDLPENDMTGSLTRDSMTNPWWDILNKPL